MLDVNVVKSRRVRALLEPYDFSSRGERAAIFERTHFARLDTSAPGAENPRTFSVIRCAVHEHDIEPVAVFLLDRAHVQREV